MDIYIKGKNQSIYLYYDGMAVAKKMPKNTDNQCEWQALVYALECINNNTINDSSYNIFTDSVLLYRQIKGQYRIKSKNLKPIYFRWNRLKNLLYDRNILYNYVIREDNTARRHMDEDKSG